MTLKEAIKRAKLRSKERDGIWVIYQNWGNEFKYQFWVNHRNNLLLETGQIEEKIIAMFRDGERYD